ncbi:MAG TPA: carbohydrate porin [Pseudomonadales bacterium]
MIRLPFIRLVAFSLATMAAAGGVQAAEIGSGSTVDVYWTQFLGAAVGGDGDDELQYGGKVDVLVDVDGRDVGLWQGFSINLRPEFRYGDSVDESGAPVLLPANVAMTFPTGDGEDFDLALSFTQTFGKTSLTAGKINMLDTTRRIPLVGGAGVEGFQHTGLAAPPSLITPPTILGALLTTPTPLGVLTVGVWDTASAVNLSGLGDAFEDDVAGMVSLTVPRKLRGRSGFHHLTVFANDKRGLDLEDIPELFLPDDSEAVLDEKRGAWHVKYAFEQYLWQSTDGARGWGVFGHAGLWDGNPSAMHWNVSLGIGGSSPFDSRPLDRFGIGYYRLSLSDALRRGLRPVLALDDEQGIEIFYTWRLGWVRLTANAQFVDSGIESADSTTFVGVRAQVSL